MEDKTADQFSSFAKKVKKPVSAGSSKAVIYTRVSSKEQAEGASLETQNNACMDMLRSKGLSLVKHFGGSYESAKSGEGKEFQSCIDYVKRNKDIGYIIVYALDRISRTTKAMAELETLQKRGVTLLSATQDFDTSTPMGGLLQELVMMVGKAENVNKTKRCVDGMINKLRRGEWIGVLPFGYTNHNPGKRVTPDYRINKQGKLLQKAFNMKAEQNLTYEEITKRLKPLGWTKEAKRLSELFKNPYYCGLIVSKRIPGEIIEGIHPPLVSRELFLKVNGMLDKNAQGWTYNKDEENLPLKGLIKAASCGRTYTGYCVKKKGLYYYKNNRIGSKENRSAKKMHEMFIELLAQYHISEPQYIPIMKEVMMDMYLEALKENIEKAEVLHQRLEEIQKDIDTVQERYALAKINDEIYDKVFTKLDEERFKVRQKLESYDFDLSNLEKALDKAIDYALNLPSVWEYGNLEERRELQNIIFPEGIVYDRKNDNYRTPRVNVLFAPILDMMGLIGGNKKRTNPKYKDLSASVPPPGVEPGS